MKIDLEKAPRGSGSRYSAQHAAPCKGRHWLKLGDAGGLAQFGVNLLTLEPGVWSSQRHWHTHEDEFVYVLEGELVMVTDAGEEIMRAGDCASFKAGVQNGHCLQNRSSGPAKILAVGSRVDEDSVGYSDIDMKWLSIAQGGTGEFTKKNGERF